MKGCRISYATGKSILSGSRNRKQAIGSIRTWLNKCYAPVIVFTLFWDRASCIKFTVERQ
jgi:hypothetical protein